MKSAKEARNKADQVNRDLMDVELAHVHTLIEEAIQKGQYIVKLSKSLYPTNIGWLRDSGYNVNSWSTYTGMNSYGEITTEISWGDAN